jgi:hypothetical protein
MLEVLKDGNGRVYPDPTYSLYSRGHSEGFAQAIGLAWEQARSWELGAVAGPPEGCGDAPPNPTSLDGRWRLIDAAGDPEIMFAEGDSAGGAALCGWAEALAGRPRVSDDHRVVCARVVEGCQHLGEVGELGRKASGVVEYNKLAGRRFICTMIVATRPSAQAVCKALQACDDGLITVVFFRTADGVEMERVVVYPQDRGSLLDEAS